MGDTLESILNGMCEIIHRIYAPFIALTMMMDMLYSVNNGVSEIRIVA